MWTRKSADSAQSRLDVVVAYGKRTGCYESFRAFNEGAFIAAWTEEFSCSKRVSLKQTFHFQRPLAKQETADAQ
jgi:hypothetical protein